VHSGPDYVILQGKIYVPGNLLVPPANFFTLTASCPAKGDELTVEVVACKHGKSEWKATRLVKMNLNSSKGKGKGGRGSKGGKAEPKGKGNGKEKGRGEGKGKGKGKDGGEWQCPSCLEINFAGRMTCFRCGPSSMQQGGSADARGGRGLNTKSPSRRFFDRKVMSGEAFETAADGKKFILAILEYDDKIDLLGRLVQGHAPKIIKLALASDSSSGFLNECTVPFLKLIGGDVYCSTLLKGSLAKLVQTLHDIPGFIEKLHDSLEEGICLDELPVGFFALLCCRDIHDARAKDSSCYKLARLLIDKESPVSRQLNNLIGFSQDIVKREPDAEIGLGLEDVRAQAGGRHNNDHADFRRIQIMPTIEELMSSDHPYLPNFVSTESGILDRQFRLLRYFQCSVSWFQP